MMFMILKIMNKLITSKIIKKIDSYSKKFKRIELFLIQSKLDEELFYNFTRLYNIKIKENMSLYFEPHKDTILDICLKKEIFVVIDKIYFDDNCKWLHLYNKNQWILYKEY